MIIVRQSLFEDMKPEENKYGCVMLSADIPDWDKLTSRAINEKDIYNDGTDEYGYEHKPHITVIFGLHDNEIVDKSLIHNIIKDMPQMTFYVNEIGVFENADNDKPFDVVKFDIKPTQQLLNNRDKFLELPNTQTFPDYHPHMTIGYVNKGEGRKHKRILKKPIKFRFNQGVYSEPDYRKTYFDLKGKNYDK